MLKEGIAGRHGDLTGSVCRGGLRDFELGYAGRGLGGKDGHVGALRERYGVCGLAGGEAREVRAVYLDILERAVLQWDEYLLLELIGHKGVPFRVGVQVICKILGLVAG